MEKLPGIPVSDADWQQTPKAVQLLVMSLLEVQQRVKQLERQVAETAARRAPSSWIAAVRQAAAIRPERRGGRLDVESPQAPVGPLARGTTRAPRAWANAAVGWSRWTRWCRSSPPRADSGGHALSGDDPHPQRRQVFEIPPVRLQVTSTRCTPCAVRAATCSPKPTGPSRCHAAALVRVCRPGSVCCRAPTG